MARKTRVPPRARRLALDASVPRAQQELYSRMILTHVRKIQAEILASLDPILRRHAIREDGNPDVSRAIGLVELRLSELFDDGAVAAQAERIGKRVIVRNAKKLERVISISLRDQGIAQTALDMFVERNVSLIKTISQRDFRRVEKIVQDNFVTGYRHENIIASIRDTFSLTKYEARRIARDQTNKLNGQVTQERYKAAGVDQWIWTTVRDERVRPEHEALDGQRFTWNAPPPEGIPGEPIQCRCFAYPVM